MATSFFDNSEEITDFEKRVWSCHADGLSLRQIADEMKKLGYRTNKDAINRIVLNLVEMMRQGLR